MEFKTKTQRADFAKVRSLFISIRGLTWPNNLSRWLPFRLTVGSLRQVMVCSSRACGQEGKNSTGCQLRRRISLVKLGADHFKKPPPPEQVAIALISWVSAIFKNFLQGVSCRHVGAYQPGLSQPTVTEAGQAALQLAEWQLLRPSVLAASHR